MTAVSRPALVERRITTDRERCYKDAISASAKLSLPDSDKACLVALIDVRHSEFVPQIIGYVSIYWSVLLYLTAVNITARGQRMGDELQSR